MIFPEFDGLTTAQVAGIIAVGIFIVQILSSLIWPLLLVAFLHDTETAVTWSVVGRTLQNSYWPTFLRTDTTASSGVRRTITALSWTIFATAILISVAAIVTPLGLYEHVGPEDTQTQIYFHYAKDSSPLGQGTAPRPELGFSRICYAGDYACPNTSNNVTFLSNDTAAAEGGYDTRIPERVYNFMTSGRQGLGPTVSSPFDVQYRNWVRKNNSGIKFGNYFDNGSAYAVGDYQPLTTLLLKDDLEVVEGLIVDLKQGGVGFRNHSVPSTYLPYGGTWSEDLLFVEPVTSCVNLNITLDYIEGFNEDYLLNVTIIDHGGFININKTLPNYDNSNDQNDPHLADRTYQGAWYNLVLLMLLWNVTNVGRNDSDFPFSYLDSHLGKGYPLPVQLNPNGQEAEFSNLLSYNAIEATLFPYLLNPALPSISSNSTFQPNASGYAHIPSNPWRISENNFTDAIGRCSGTFIQLPSDKSISNRVVGECGILLGIPLRKDNPSSASFERGSEWTMPLYTCATVNRASVKTVYFNYNGSQGFEGLSVRNITPKAYSKPSGYPLWAFENITDVPPESVAGDGAFSPQFFWGMVAKEDDSFTNMTYKRSPEALNLAAVDGPPAISSETYSTGLFGQFDKVADYSGTKNEPLYNLWKNLTATSGGTSKMINLIWTDIAANALVGTRGWIPSDPPPNLLNKRDSGGSTLPTQVLVPIQIFHRTVQYHIKYAIPAFLVLAVLACSLVSVFVLLLLGRATPGRVKLFLTRLSSGRIMTGFLDKAVESTDEKDSTVPTKQWLKRSGRMRVDVSTPTPREAGHAAVVEEEAKTASKEERQRLHTDSYVK